MASRFWVGGTGNLDGSTTTHIAATSNGAGGASYPGSGDTLTLDANSGGGTVTVTAAHTIQSLTMGAFTGTFDNSGNHNFAFSANTGLNYSGSGTRTITLGSATYTFTGVGTSIINGATQTNLTLSSSSANLVFTATTASQRALSVGSGATFGSITVNANSSGGSFNLNAGLAAITFGSLTVATPNAIIIPNGVTTTVTDAINIAGAGFADLVSFYNSAVGGTGTISSANNGTFDWCAFRDIAFAGGGTFTADNAIDLKHNSGITLNAPSAGAAGGAHIIGGTVVR
jgi:hypothetical protein